MHWICSPWGQISEMLLNFVGKCWGGGGGGGGGGAFIS